MLAIMSDVTHILNAIDQSDPTAADPVGLGRSPCARRRAGKVAATGSGQGGARNLTLLRRYDHRAGVGSAQQLTSYCPSLLDLRAGLAAPADDGGSGARIGHCRN